MSYLTDEQILEGVRKAGGRIMLAAKSLGIEADTIQNHRKRNPDLDIAIKKIRGSWNDELVDLAEWQLRQGVMEGKPWAIIFTLKTLGAQRGYVEHYAVSPAREAEEDKGEELRRMMLNTGGNRLEISTN